MSLVNSSGVVALASAAGWSPPDEFDEFRIVRSLGIGAMGEVYLAHDLLLERYVAVKFVHTARDAAARARVLEEARAIARLQHPNVVAIHRVADFAGHPYLVSEYVHGVALNQLERPRPWRQVLDIAIDLTRGLAAAHRRGVLHRDVKPANAILTDEGRAKLLDFGLAVIMDNPAEQLAVATVQPAANGVTLRDAATAVTSPVVGSAIDGQGPDPDSYLAGTPIYMAPELWRGEAATRRSDLYSLGILLYELLSGEAPYRDVPLGALGGLVQARDITSLAEVAPGVEPALVAIVDRLIKRDPAARFSSADALLVALEECAAPAPKDASPDGNPYRGLAVFESAHASLFFGRRSEIRELVARVRAEAFVVVGGDSGTGKSSLCRAGVLPLLENDGWSCVEVLPGRRPVRSLAAALAPWAAIDEAALSELLRDSPDAVARAIRQHVLGERAIPRDAADRPDRKDRRAPTEPAEAGQRTRRRLLLFVDQLEELLTLAEPEEARAVAAAIAALAVRSPLVRVLATGRSDFLSRLAMLPGLGEEMARGLYFLRPLTGEHIREVVVRPATAKGVSFESEALVDALVEQTEHAPGGLPLLQFTLAELWDARDLKTQTIRAAALTALGGVGGALTRHADRLLAGLGNDELDAVRRILLRLVTSEGTRTRRPESELLTTGEARDTERAALETLVHGRIVVANNAHDGAYEIAHEALLTGWSTLQGWLQLDVANHALRESIEQAAAAWERMGRAGNLLWARRQLNEARAVDVASLAPRETTFLAASATAIRRRRVFGSAVAAALVISAVAVGLVIRTRARRELESVVAKQLQEATSAADRARRIAGKRDETRVRAFELFDTYRWPEGEKLWNEVDDLTAQEESEFRQASAHLEGALLLDPTRSGLLDQLAGLTYERLRRADRDRHRDLADELRARLTTYGGREPVAGDARVELAIDPPGTQVWVERKNEPRQALGKAPLSTLTLRQGSIVIELSAPGRVATRLPLLLESGQTRELKIALPEAATAPRDMIYVPRGPFLFGSADPPELRVGFLRATPLHEVWTDAYYIARNEVTFAQWIEFLDELPLDERRRRRPDAESGESKQKLVLTEIAPKRWRLSMQPTTHNYTAETGGRIHYEHRKQRADQDWTKFPVAGVSYEDALAFAAWLDRTGRLPGARTCDEYEWERAARGADGRRFPHGDELAPDDANIDVTYDRDPLAFGPDEIGSHPASRSPVGADDMAGNAWEWVGSVEERDRAVNLGGGWYQNELGARTMNRVYAEPTERHPRLGVRLCATPRARQGESGEHEF